MWCHLASLSRVRMSVLSFFTIIKCYNCSYDFRVSSSPPLWSTLQILESSCSVFSPSTRRLHMHWFYFWASSPRQQSQICQSLALSSQIWFLWRVWKQCVRQDCAPHVACLVLRSYLCSLFWAWRTNTCWTYFRHSPIRTIGTWGEKCRISGVHLDKTFSNDVLESIE